MWESRLDNMAAIGHVMSMNTTTRPETSQERLNRLMREAADRRAIGTTLKNSSGTARWNGDAWVYGKGR